MEDIKKDLSKKNDYQYGQDDISRVNEGIKIIEEVWNKYIAHIEKIALAKMKHQDALKTKGLIMVLKDHLRDFRITWEFDRSKLIWQDFKSAWNFDCFRLGLPDYEIKPNQYYVDKKKSLDCFAQKLTQLYYLVQGYAYPCWLDRLYQFIKTSLLKIHNALFAGSRNISSENVYITAAHAGYAPMMPSYRPKKHNFFICHETLSDNIDLLQKDLTFIENWQTASRLDNTSPNR